MSTEPGTCLRADARRNRDRILTAARAAFARQGAEVSLNEIARSAGVGIGTLYRRFPDRNALLRVIAVDNLDRLRSDVRAARDQEASDWDALIRLLHHSVELQLCIQLTVGLPRAPAILTANHTIRALRDELLSTLSGLVQGAQSEGTLRQDAVTGDILILFAMLLQQRAGGNDDTTQMAIQRGIAIMIDGLRQRMPTGPGPDPRGSLPGPRASMRSDRN